MKGRHLWLIGAGEGIGAATAVRLAAEGAILTLSSRNADSLETLLQRLPGDGHAVLPLDVTDAAATVAVYKRLRTERPPLDVLWYNAGTYEPMTAQQLLLEAVEHMLDVNLRGMYRVLAQVLPDFLRRNRGHIALTGSVAGYRGLPGTMGYGAGKAAVIHLAESLHIDLASTDIRVQLINPGFVATRLTAKNNFPMRYIITPEQAAEAIVHGLKSSAFEIHFPKRFSYLLKALRLLPIGAYFRAVG